MKLRARLALTLVLLVVPFGVGLTLLEGLLARRAFIDNTASFAVERMEGGERAICEAVPERWPHVRGGRLGRGRPGLRGRLGRSLAGVVFAYDASFESANPFAPPFDPELARRLSAGADVASRTVRGPRGPVERIAARMPWHTGPCAVLLAQRPAPRRFVLTLATLLPTLGVSTAAVLLAVLAAGPIVGRIRLLTAAVRRTTAPDAPAVEMGGHDEIAELARAFEQSRRALGQRMNELEARDAALNDYLANTTHDVMIPLTVLQGHLVAVDASFDAGETPDRAALRGALEESHYLASLIRNLSAAAKLEAGVRPLERHPLDLNALVERVVARHAPIGRRKGVAIDFAVPETPIVIEGDVTLLEQAVGNLVHNSVRYHGGGFDAEGGPAGHVAVVLERAHGAGKGEEVLLRVVDDGPGIAEADLARITERRFRGDAARTRHPSGTGLGLAIAREAVERHGFRMTFSRPADGGLAVEIRGPIEGAAAEGGAGGAHTA